MQFTNSYLQSANLSALHDLASRRITEIQSQKQDTLQLPQVAEMIELYGSEGVSSKLQDELLPTFIEYNQVVWEGGPESYLTCNLQVRGPEYLGECFDRITCTRDNNTIPYECNSTSGLTPEECNARYKVICIKCALLMKYEVVFTDVLLKKIALRFVNVMEVAVQFNTVVVLLVQI